MFGFEGLGVFFMIDVINEEGMGGDICVFFVVVGVVSVFIWLLCLVWFVGGCGCDECWFGIVVWF